MKRVLITTVLIVVVLAAVIAFYFRPGHTRFTPLPAIATGATLHLKPPRAVILVIDENKSPGDVLDDLDRGPYIRSLASRGALFTNSYGITHPSQPNYFALFSGQATSNADNCPAVGIANTAPNLASELLAAHRTFVAYSEDLPSVGYDGCATDQYARKHAPWTHFTNVPRYLERPFSQLSSPDDLPDVTFIIPNLIHDMHSASVERGDAWLQDHLEPIIQWGALNNALVIYTFDESSAYFTNRIPTIFIGPMVKPGKYDEPMSHYSVLRTIEDLYALPHAGHSAEVAPIVDIWRS